MSESSKSPQRFFGKKFAAIYSIYGVMYFVFAVFFFIKGENVPFFPLFPLAFIALSIFFFIKGVRWITTPYITLEEDKFLYLGQGIFGGNKIILISDIVEVTSKKVVLEINCQSNSSVVKVILFEINNDEKTQVLNYFKQKLSDRCKDF